MLCYKDMTFCSFYKDCKLGKKCFRVLTEDIESKATASNMLIAQFIMEPECFKEYKTKKKYSSMEKK
jgi:hypothetical protein